MHLVKGSAQKKPHLRGAAVCFELKNSEISHHSLGRGMVMVSDSIFVLHHLAVQFVNQVIDGGIQVLVRAFCKLVVSFHVDIALSSLSFFFLFLFFNGEQHFDIDHLVKVPFDSV